MGVRGTSDASISDKVATSAAGTNAATSAATLLAQLAATTDLPEDERLGIETLLVAADVGAGRIPAASERIATLKAVTAGEGAIAAGALRGMQDTRTPMAIALFSYWVPGFGGAVLLGFFTPLGGMGVWIGLAAGLVFASALLLWRFYRRDRLGLLPSSGFPAPLA